MRVCERAGQVERRRFDVLLADVVDDVRLHGRHHLVRAQRAQYDELVKARQQVERFRVLELVGRCAVVHVLPPVRVSLHVYTIQHIPYQLRARSHSMTLINRTKFLSDNDFLVRMLHKNAKLPV